MDNSFTQNDRLIDSLLKDYNLVYRVMLSDASFIMLKMDEGIVGEGMEFADFNEAKAFFEKEVVYRPDREMIRREVDFDRIRERLESEDRYSVEYRAVIDGVAIWHEMTVVSLGEGEIAIAFAMRDSEILDRHISLALRDSFDGIYVVNLNTDQMKVLKASGISENKPAVLRYSSFIKEFAAGLSGEEREYYEQTADVELMKRRLQAEGKRTNFYLSPNYGEKPVWVKSEVHVLTWDDGVPETAVITSTRVDSVQSSNFDLNNKLKESLALTDYFLDTYVSAYYVGLDDLTCQVYKRTEELEREYPEITNFVESLQKYITQDVHPDDREKLFEITQPEYLRKMLAKQPEFSHIFRDISGGTEKTYRFQAIRGADEAHIAFGFIDITEEMQSKEEQQKLINLRSFGNMVNAALWNVYIDDNDEITEVYWSDEMRQMFGYEDEDDFPNVEEAWSGRLHPDDREAVMERFRDGFKSEGSEEFVDETSYRLMKKSGEYGWFRAAGRMETAPDGRRRMVGLVKDISADMELEAQRQEAEEAKKLIESVASVYRFAFAVDMAKDAFRVIRLDDEVINRLHNAEFTSYSDAIAPLFEMLHPAERERMARELDFNTIRKNLETKISYNTEYRVLTNGATTWHEMNVTHINNEEVAIGFGERDIEITKRHLEENRFAEYFALYEVDIETNMVKIIVDSPYYGLSQSGTALPYSSTMKAFSASLEGEARDFFKQIANLDYIKEELKQEGKHTFTYRSGNLEDNRWVDCTIYVTHRDENGVPSMFTLGFSYIDTHGAARQDLQSKISEQKLLLEEQQRQLQEALDTANNEAQRTDMIIYAIDASKWSYDISADDEVVAAYYSEGLYNLAGKETSERPMGWFDRVLPEDKGRVLNEFMAPVFDHSGKTIYDSTFRILGDDGEIKWTRSVGRVARHADGSGEYFGMVLNLTDQMKQQEKLEEALSMAQAANRAKTEFLFNMSHDIRTPMNAILGFTNIAEKHIDDKDKVTDCLDKTKQSGNLLLTLINSVLDMSRIESGSAEFVENAGDVYYSFVGIESTLKETAASRDINLSFEFGEVTDRYVYADFTRCLRVFTNLISNAIKYSRAGGDVRVYCEQATPNRDGTAWYRYIVEDNGMGMSKEFQEHMFEAFTREQNSTTSGIQGTGLGLSVCKTFVDYLGGTIDCESRPGEGTKFTVELPFRIQEEEKFTDPVTGEVVSADSAAVVAKMTEDFRGRSVLLVEDNELNMEIAVDILEEEGLVVEEADDGTAAVEILKAKGPDYYDFILMDIQMPKMNGYEATKAIREMYPGAKLPIIAISANAFEEDKKASKAAGMDDHVAKPINITELFAALAKFL